MRQEEVRDCPSAWDRDFLSALAEPERLALLARRDVRTRRPRDAWQRAVPQPVQWVVKVQRVAPLRALLVILQAQADESE